jgi:hypothetical protein
MKMVNVDNDRSPGPLGTLKICRLFSFLAGDEPSPHPQIERPFRAATESMTLVSSSFIIISELQME